MYKSSNLKEIEKETNLERKRDREREKRIEKTSRIPAYLSRLIPRIQEGQEGREIDGSADEFNSIYESCLKAGR